MAGMIDALRQLAVFAKTVECGSFRQAAKELNLSPSVISYHIAQLEAQLGRALLYRTTRQLSLTSSGQEVYESARRMLIEAEHCLQTENSTPENIKGKLVITIAALMLHSSLFKRIGDFGRHYPLVTLDIRVTDQRVNLFEQGIDLALRIGNLTDNQASLKCKKLAPIRRVLIAAQSLIDQRAMPDKPQDLMHWPWIGLAMLPFERHLYNAQGEKITLTFEPRFLVNHVEAMTELAKQGLGLATPPDYLITKSLASGEVVELFPQWQVDPIDVFAVWPIQTKANSLTHRLIEFLTNTGAHSGS
jgi:DNA-binding transcriptional LysR family regulator